MGASQSSSSESTPLKTAKDDTLLEVEGAAKSDGAKRDGALEAGGSVRIFEARNAGYILQYFAVGMLYRGISATSYGFFNAYLNAPAYVQAASSTLASIPWSFKIFFAILTDAIPIAGYRRRPWMVIGWSIAALALVALALWPLPEPYYCMGTDDAGRPALNQTSVCNPSAREAGMPYAILMMIAAVGFVQADVAADALTVSYARREPLTTRGRTQTMAYLTREIGMVAARLLVGLGMNGPEYNGSFSSGLSLNSVFAILAVPAVAMVPVSWLLIDETPVVSLPTAVAAGSAGSAGGKGAEEVPWTVRNYAVTAYALLRSGAIFDVVCFAFLTSAIGGIGTTAGPMVMRVWADVQALQNQLFSIVGHLLFVLGLSLVRSYFLNSSWRWMLAITLLVVNVLDAPFTFLTVFNVVRNQYFFLEGMSADLDPPASGSSHPCYPPCHPPCQLVSILRPLDRPIPATIHAMVAGSPRSIESSLRR